MFSKADRQLPSVKQYRKIRDAKWGLKAASYLCAMTPDIIICGVNYDEWFAPQTSTGPSLGVGFGMMLVSLILTLLAIFKRDTDFMTKFSPLFYVAVLCACWGISFYFLATIMNEAGQMFIYTAIGVMAGGVCDQCEKDLVEPKYLKAKECISKHGLSSYGAWEKAFEKQASDDEIKKTHNPVE
jgi:hypothetical protein